MATYDQYKKFRNAVAKFGIHESLAVMWAYSQYRQVPNFKMPRDIEVDPSFSEGRFGQPYPWQLECLAREVLLHSGLASERGRTLRKWNDLAQVINGMRALEEALHQKHVADEGILHQLLCIAHQQFPWQERANTQHASRYLRVMQNADIDAISQLKLRLPIAKFFMIGLVLWGHFTRTHQLRDDANVDIPNLTRDDLSKFLAIVATDLDAMQREIRMTHSVDETYVYQFNPIRKWPLIKMREAGTVFYVCPFPKLFFSRVTSGLYFDLWEPKNDFGNAFGSSFQAYIGEMLGFALAKCDLRVLPEFKFKIGGLEKASVDWMVTESTDAAVFLECKVKRLTVQAKAEINDLAAFEKDVGHLADAVVQTYEGINLYRQGAYSGLPFVERRIVYPLVVTIEEWYAIQHPIGEALDRMVVERLKRKNLPEAWLLEFPFSIVSADQLERVSQIWKRVGVDQFFKTIKANEKYKGWLLSDAADNAFQEAARGCRPLFGDQIDELIKAASQKR